MESQEIDIIKILQEIAQNEHEAFNAFRERFVEYCTDKENAVFAIFRFLWRTEQQLNECLIGKIKVDVDRAIIIKVLRTIKIEIEIIRCRMRHPEIFDHISTKPLQPLGKWTSDKIDLIELIYTIKMSINDGKVTIKALQDCFEFIFQVKLGNIYDRFSEINERKGEKPRYLESLIKYLNQLLDNLNS